MADVTMTVNSDKTASLSRGYLAVQGEQITVTVNIATALQTLVTTNTYSAFIDFLQPDGLSYFKGPFTPASETFDLTLGASDSILDKDGFVYWQFLLCEYDTEAETRTVKWASKKYRTEVLSSVGAKSSAVLPYVPQMVFPTTYPAANIELTDVGGYFTSDTAEAALQQIKSENATHLADESAHDIGNKTYTEQNYVTNDESITDSLDSLDMKTKDVLDGGASTPFTNMPYVGTAPIVESGSNANGTYTKFADGTAIYYRKVVIDISLTTQQTFDMPLTMTSVCFGAMSQVTGTFVVQRLRAITTASVRALTSTWQVTVIDNTTAFDFEVVLIAIGKWK